MEQNVPTKRNPFEVDIVATKESLRKLKDTTTKEDIPAVFFKHYAIFMEGKMNVSELARVCGLSRPTV